MGTGAPAAAPPVGADPEVVYARHASALTRFATVLVGPADAADVVSEAVLACFRSPGWAAVDDHGAYLHRAVLNAARQWARTAARRRQREDSFGRSDLTTAQPGSERGAVWDAVRRLSVRQRAVVYLTYWLDLPPAEVAARLGVSEGAVRRHLARAREKLREELGDG